MKACYLEVLSSLLQIIEPSKDSIEKNTPIFETSVNSLFNLADNNFRTYRSIVDTNETRAIYAIEKLAASLFIENKIQYFEDCPVPNRYKNCNQYIQEARKPFKIMLKQNDC